MNSNFVSMGRNPNCEYVCQTCGDLKHAENRNGGWCQNSANRVPPQPGWLNGFMPSVSSTGGCDLHTKGRILEAL